MIPKPTQKSSKPSIVMKNVLCVCTRDVSRAPMMAILLRNYLASCGQTDFKVESAGVKSSCDGHPATEQAVHCLCAEDVSFRPSALAHTSRCCDDIVLGAYSTFVVPDDMVCDILTGQYRVNPAKILVVTPQIMDPYGLGQNVYNNCRWQIIRSLPAIADFVTRVELSPQVATVSEGCCAA